MQEIMIEKLKKEAGATIVDIKDISYDAGFLFHLLRLYNVQIGNACGISQVPWNEVIAATPFNEQGICMMINHYIDSIR